MFQVGNVYHLILFFLLQACVEHPHAASRCGCSHSYKAEDVSAKEIALEAYQVKPVQVILEMRF